MRTPGHAHFPLRLAAVALIALFALASAPAYAVFPGTNGKIVYERDVSEGPFSSHLWLVTNLGLRLRVLAAGWTAGAVGFAAVAALTIPAIDARGASTALSCGLLAAAVTMAGLLGDRAVRATTSAAVLGAALVLGAGAAAGAL